MDESEELYIEQDKTQVLVGEKNIKKEIRPEFVCLGWMGEFDYKEAIKLKLVTIQQGSKESPVLLTFTSQCRKEFSESQSG